MAEAIRSQHPKQYLHIQQTVEDIVKEHNIAHEDILLYQTNAGQPYQKLFMIIQMNVKIIFPSS